MSRLIKHPHVTEKSMDEMDFQNKLIFVVDVDAAKPEIVDAVQSRYDVTVEDVNTQITPDGEKKATLVLSDADDAQEVASRIGVF